jgi:NlpC/P60 family putative phage cell wall peptidase
MVTRAEIVAEARSWLGTPHMHQLQHKGVGADCGGFVRGVMGALGAAPADARQWEGAADYAGYHRNPDAAVHKLKSACDRYLVRVPRQQMQLGSVLLFKFERAQHAGHCGIVGDYRGGPHFSLIHSLSRVSPTKSGVIEHVLDSVWTRRIVAVYDFPGVT